MSEHVEIELDSDTLSLLSANRKVGAFLLSDVNMCEGINACNGFEAYVSAAVPSHIKISARELVAPDDEASIAT